MITIYKYGLNRNIYNNVCVRLLNSNKFKQSFAPIFSFASNVKKYSERRVLGYSKQQLYEVVSGVEFYSQFVPNCTKSLVTHRSQTFIKADLEISIAPIICEQFSSNVTLVPPTLVASESSDSNIFNYIKSEWKFSDGLPNNLNSCTIDYNVMFELKSQLHLQLVNIFFDHLASKTVDAFINRAQTLYGKQQPIDNNMLYKS